MELSNQLPDRLEVSKKNQWNLSDLFTNDNDWRDACQTLSLRVEELEYFHGKLMHSSKTLLEYMLLKDELYLLLEKVYSYAMQKYDEDTTNSTYQSFKGEAEHLLTRYSQITAFEAPEILSFSEVQLKQFIYEQPELDAYVRYLKDILRQKKHTLSDEMESLLSLSSDTAGTAKKIFSMFNNADLTFPAAIDGEGHEIPLSHGNFISLLESKDRDLRKSAFTQVYHTYAAYQNTLAAIYEGNVKKDLFYAKARKYHSSLERHLDTNDIPVSVYDQLIDTVHEFLPVMYDYVDFRKQQLNVDELHMYDIYTPLLEDHHPAISFDTAKNLVSNGLSLLGDDYTALLKEGFRQRWIDVYENKGKRSGAYSTCVYGTHPYVLLNYQPDLNHVFTLAHEMGHALHSYYTNQAQSYVNADYSIFVAEIASTCNEALLMNHMLNHSTDRNEKIYLLNYLLDQFKGTVFRQTMFAEFEKITHEKAARGETLTAEVLCKIYHDLNVLYFGPNIVIDSEIDMEWARIPHFYSPFYVYQYATGFSAAMALSTAIINEGEPAVARYKQFLSGGCSQYPIQLLKTAGVDMTTKIPVHTALNTFKDTLTQLKKLI